MKKMLRITTPLLPIFFICCNKTSNIITAEKLTLVGKWTLVETLADPGDGSGQWTPVNKPDYYFLQFNMDNSIETNTYTGLGGLTHYKVMNDSSINFIYANGTIFSLFYKINGSSLAIMGGCYENCGSRFIRKTPQYCNLY